MPTLPVKFFDHTMQGAPQLTNDWGCMTTVLDAVLVNGFNLKSVGSITSAAGIATANIPAGHLYRAGQALSMAGADQPEYNGEVRALSVTANSFTYAISGSPASPATGASLSAKVAPLGWEIAFTGPNKRAYRSKNVLSNRPYLRVDDGLDPAYTTTYAKKAKVTMAQGMSDIDTFVGARAPYDSLNPTKNEIGTGSGTTAYDGWFKWYYAKKGGNSAEIVAPAAYNRPWTIIGDDRGFFLFNEAVDAGGFSGRCFTDFESYRTGDGFNTLLAAQNHNAAASTPPSTVDSEGYNSSDHRARFSRSLDSLGKVCMKSYLQIGIPVALAFTSLNTNNSINVSGYRTGIDYPNGPDYSLILHPVLLTEGVNLRGKLPGMFWVHNNSPAFNHLDTITGVAGYPGRTFMLVSVAFGEQANNYNGWLAFDVTGPWW